MAPQVSKKKYMEREQLMALVAEIVEKEGGPTAVARKLGISQSAVSQAVRDGKSSNDGIRVRILTEVAHLEVQPAWSVAKPSKVPKK